jgi:hypothetical protein
MPYGRCILAPSLHAIFKPSDPDYWVNDYLNGARAKKGGSYQLRP